jgi:hypothetical protein
MSDSTGEQRLAEVLREIIALSQTGRSKNPASELTDEIEAAANESESGSHKSLEQGGDPV